jgi:hypothetical protein
MNTQLQDRPTVDTVDAVALDTRPEPVWSEPTRDAERSTSPRRRIRWTALGAGVLAATAATALIWAAVGDTSFPDPEPTPRPAFDSPGGNSLNIAPDVAPSVDRSAWVELPNGQRLDVSPGDVSSGDVSSVDRSVWVELPNGRRLEVSSGSETSPLRAPSGFDSPGGNSMTLP